MTAPPTPQDGLLRTMLHLPNGSVTVLNCRQDSLTADRWLRFATMQRTALGPDKETTDG